MGETAFTATVNKVRPVLAEAPPPPLPQVRKDDLWIRILTPLASLRITVVLFALALLLVFFGTLAMMTLSIQNAVDEYFRAWGIVWFPWQILVRFGQRFYAIPSNVHIDGSFPFPGGWLLGALMMVNLLAAHAVRFKLTWKRSGILVLHAGLIVLMVSEFIAGKFAAEGNMAILVGESSNYLQDPKRSEMAIVTPVSSKEDDVVVIPDSILREGGLIQNDLLPFELEVRQFMPNSTLVPVEQAPKGSKNLADTGDGLDVVAVERPVISGTDTEQKVDLPAAYVTLRQKDTGASLGTYLFSMGSMTRDYPPQKVALGDTHYQVSLRLKRTYKPYTVELLKFHHGVYPGTDKPKDFSSYVRLADPDNHVDREARIWMNHPLRYAGETFYQSSVLGGDQGTVLQVVRNPGWLLPYIACIMVALGMLIHFMIKLTTFLSKTLKAGSARPAARFQPGFWIVPALVLGVGGLGLAALALRARQGDRGDRFHLQEAAKLPVLDGGRVKPLDSLARTDLMVISGQQSYQDENDNAQPAIKWLFDVAASRVYEKVHGEESPARKYRIFRIENMEVLNLLGLEPRSGLRYAINEFADKLGKFEKEAARADKLRRSGRELDLVDSKILELADHLSLYIHLAELDTLLVPPPPGGDTDAWMTLPAALRAAHAGGKGNPAAAEAVTKLIIAYAKGDTKQFNEELADYHKLVQQDLPAATRSAGLEVFFNNFAPFIVCMALYTVAFLLACLSWLFWPGPLRRAAFWLLLLTFALHTAALLGRMYLQGRPPVTNLYSSAIFIGWGCVVLGLGLEYIFRIGIGSAVGAVTGFLAVFVSHWLAQSGDTLGMMEAVLDTNFWLATHVTCVTFGYTATFVAGFLGIVYLGIRAVARLVDPRLNTLQVELGTGVRADLFKVVSQMLYGVLCFATLFSFTGTVLGGIWADQSWGRFWGWDPKENGALLIVVWNALVLHARWAGLVKSPGMARLAVVGNIVTFWSWFGTNQLGVGLHTYGINKQLVLWCRWFWIVQIVLLGLELLSHVPWQRRFGKPQASTTA
jgi:ABC-type transport system involved in cytochrome c biogenesis permease subunit